MTTFLAGTTSIHEPIFQREVARLMIYFTCAKITAATMSLIDETLFDDCTKDFEDIILLSKQFLEHESATIQLSNCETSVPRFTFDAGIIMPLYFTASRCRDPLLRRQAIEVMLNPSRQEGCWESTTAVKIAERVIWIEEHGLKRVYTARNIPTTSRVRCMNVKYYPGIIACNAR